MFCSPEQAAGACRVVTQQSTESQANIAPDYV